MNEIVVPVDLTGEEKEVLAYFSKRQFFILFPTSVSVLIFFVWGDIPFIPPKADFIIRLLAGLFTLGVSTALAFLKLDKFEQYLSEYIITMIRYKYSQKTYHH